MHEFCVLRLVKRSSVFLIISILVCTCQLWAGEINSDLHFKLRNLRPSEYHSCLVILKERAKTEQLNLELTQKRANRITRHQVILNSLRAKASQTQVNLLGYLKGRRIEKSVKEFKSFWIANIIQVTATREEIEKIALMPEVEKIYDDAQIELIQPISCENNSSSDTSNKDNFDAIGVRKVWNMGFTGKGRLVCNFDSGVEGTHPALSSKWRGNNGGTSSSSWFDPYGSSSPCDSRGHGTHTMGIMVGSTPGDTLGVAFGAQWISAGVVDRGVGVSQTISDILSAFQWAVDPDGNIQTTDDVPDVINNSWGVPLRVLPSCDQVFWEAIDNVERAGIVTIFSAGNEGPNSFTIRNPADRTNSPYNSLAVGAINAHADSLPVATFSSRGPSVCDSQSIKPELSAPGVEVRSCYKDGQYKVLSGTSMAAPFVAGAVAILREYNPDATVEQIKDALIRSAVDLGTPGEDNDYGYGLINIQKALEYIVPPSTPCVYLDSIITEEKSMDSVVCGDTVKIGVNLKNAGTKLSPFKVKLQTSDMGVILFQSEVRFDSLAQGGMFSNKDNPFVFYLVPSQEEKIINFKLNIVADNEGYSRQIDFNLLAKPGFGLGVNENLNPPIKFGLGQNFPNPFNPSTTIPFDLEKETYVILKIYNIKGQLVETLLEKSVSRGRYEVTWKAEDQDGVKVASGVYFYVLKTDERYVAKKMFLVK
ncbi:MAG: S8 family serine peptidase [candidate division Zixibacteria bacterium]|nr:S8 family serine peptidase [candidate division Zixibacteria bacterium]